jgi:hypothetical protein
MKRYIPLILIYCAALLQSACTVGSRAGFSETDNAQFNADQATRISSLADMQLYRVNAQAGITNYVVVSKGRARSGEFIVVTHFSSDAAIQRVEIGSYPYTHGRRIKSSKFLNQFTDWDTTSEIDAITTATNSSKAATDAVRKSKEMLTGYLRR